MSEMLQSPNENEALIDAISDLLLPLLNSMEALNYVSRNLHPPNLGNLVTGVENVDTALRRGLKHFRNQKWPEHLSCLADQMITAAEAVCSGFDSLRDACCAPDGIFMAYRGIRQNAKAFAAIYPAAFTLPPINRFFLNEAGRADEVLLEKLANADAGRENVGVIHANNEKGRRGGFSVYVPEYYDDATAYPLIMALHGGSGHGRDFLWTWLREARSRGAILITPTSLESTWSLMAPEKDSARLEKLLTFAKGQWNIDTKFLLMTGMSDGGTFTYVSGLEDASPFTHLAPISASFHPLMLEMMDPTRCRDLPIYLTHGALDWMFPVQVARDAEQALRRAGANVCYREIKDLSHTYPNDENGHILDWFLNRHLSLESPLLQQAPRPFP